MGGGNPRVGPNLLFGIFFVENYLKMTKNGSLTPPPHPPPSDPPIVINFSCNFEAEIQSTINDEYCLGADESEAQGWKQEDEEADGIRQIRR